MGLMPTEIAASIPLITLSKSPSLVISLKRTGSRESIEILALLMPLFFSFDAIQARGEH